MPQGVWDLCQRCWATSPVVRPKFTEIAAVLGKMYTAPQSASRKGTLNTGEASLCKLMICDSSRDILSVCDAGHL